jgi:predicted HAD superfamily Cof-like phosphohydrolase
MIRKKMYDPYSALLDFHRLFGLDINIKPTLVSEQTTKLRINLINEEAKEFENACNDGNLVEIADAIADLLYVVYGAAVTYGISAEDVFNEVHRSNMTKLWPDGTVHRRDGDGKIMKPDTYSPANIKSIIGL